MNEKIGTKIRQLRLEKQLTQPQLAKAIGVSNGIISQWENNVNEPKASYIISLANVLNISTDYLLCREEEDGRIIVQELPLPQDERRLINYYKDLPNKLKTAILEHAKTIYELNNTNNLNTYDKRSN